MMKVVSVRKLIPYLFFFLPLSLFGQNDSVEVKRNFYNEIGLDLSNTVFLIRKSDDIYLINYKRHFKNIALRSGANLRWETTETGEKSVDFRLGIEWKKTSKKWQVFYGIDLGYSHKNYNFQGNTITKYIVAPLVGFRYYLSPRFSMSTEPKLAFKYIVNRDPKAFNPDANNENIEIGLGSIGVVLVNFHF